VWPTPLRWTMLDHFPWEERFPACYPNGVPNWHLEQNVIVRLPDPSGCAVATSPEWVPCFKSGRKSATDVFPSWNREFHGISPWFLPFFTCFSLESFNLPSLRGHFRVVVEVCPVGSLSVLQSLDQRLGTRLFKVDPRNCSWRQSDWRANAWMLSWLLWCCFFFNAVQWGFYERFQTRPTLWPRTLMII